MERANGCTSGQSDARTVGRADSRTRRIVRVRAGVRAAGAGVRAGVHRDEGSRLVHHGTPCVIGTTSQVSMTRNREEKTTHLQCTSAAPSSISVGATRARAAWRVRERARETARSSTRTVRAASTWRHATSRDLPRLRARKFNSQWAHYGGYIGSSFSCRVFVVLSICDM